MLGKFKNKFGSEKLCFRFVGVWAKCNSLKLVDKKYPHKKNAFPKV
jgi:hypothetical protein